MLPCGKTGMALNEQKSDFVLSKSSTEKSEREKVIYQIYGKKNIWYESKIKSQYQISITTMS